MQQAPRLSNQFFYCITGQAEEGTIGTQDHTFGIRDDHAFLSIERGGGYAQFSIGLVQRLALQLQVGLNSFATLYLLRECEVMLGQFLSMAIQIDKLCVQPRRVLTHWFEGCGQYE